MDIRSRGYSTNTNRPYLKFNIVSIPSEKSIDDAELFLYVSYDGSYDYALSIYHSYNHSWTEGTLTWNVQPCGSTLGSLNSDECNTTAEDTITIGQVVGSWVNWNVTNMVRNEYNNNDNNVSMLIPSLDKEEQSSLTYRKYFNSKEYTTDTTLRPYLNITYSEEAPTYEPSVISTLVSPADASEDTDGNVTFNCSATATDSILKNVSLYHNISGTFKVNATNTVGGTSNKTNFTINDIPDTTNLVWNCLASNNETNTSFADANWTLTINISVPPPPVVKIPKFFIQNLSGIKQWWVNSIGNMWLKGDLDVSGANATFEQDVTIKGTLHGGSPVKIAGGLIIDGGNVNISSDYNFTSGYYTILNYVGSYFNELLITAKGAIRYTDNDETVDVMFLNVTSGYVGIGTTTPTSKLHVIGNVTATGDLTAGGNIIASVGAAATPSIHFEINPDTGIYYIHPDKIGFAIDGSLALRLDDYGVMIIDGAAAAPSYSFFNDDDSGFYRIGEDNIGLTLNGIKRVDFAVAGTTITGNTYLNNTLNVVNGKVGIGTTNPIRTLDVNGVTRISGGGLLVGDVVPGNPANPPEGEVWVMDDDIDVRVILGEGTSSGESAGMKWNSAGNYLSIYHSSVGTGSMVFDSSGNVGIGTTTPNEKLTVVGNQNLTGNFSGDQFYGETNIHPDGNITVIINTQGVHENITGFNETHLNGFTLSGNHSLVANVAGRYSADFWISMAGGTKKIYSACLAVNNEHATPHAHRKQGSAGDIGSMSGGGIIELNEGDIINLQIRNEDGTQNADIFFAGMRFVRIGS